MNVHNNSPSNCLANVRKINGDPALEYELLDPRDIPNNPRMIGIVALYETSNKRKCSLPECGTQHNKGYVVDINQGFIAIGNNCGEKLFGVDWKSQKDYALASIRQKETNDRKEKFLSRWESLQDIILSIMGYMRQSSEARKIFIDSYPHLFRYMKYVVQSEAHVLKIRSKNDGIAAAAIRESEKLAGRMGKSSTAQFTHESFHIISGATFFTKNDPLKVFNSGVDILKNAYYKLREDEPDHSKINRILTDTIKGFTKLRESMKAHGDVVDFFSHENIEKICAWSQISIESPTEIRVRYKGKNITIQERGSKKSVNIMAPLQIPRELIDRLEGIESN